MTSTERCSTKITKNPTTSLSTPIQNSLTFSFWVLSKMRVSSLEWWWRFAPDTSACFSVALFIAPQWCSVSCSPWDVVVCSLALCAASYHSFPSCNSHSSLRFSSTFMEDLNTDGRDWCRYPHGCPTSLSIPLDCSSAPWSRLRELSLHAPRLQGGDVLQLLGVGQAHHSQSLRTFGSVCRRSEQRDWGKPCALCTVYLSVFHLKNDNKESLTRLSNMSNYWNEVHLTEISNIQLELCVSY